jgi:hypothetical protein
MRNRGKSQKYKSPKSRQQRRWVGDQIAIKGRRKQTGIKSFASKLTWKKCSIRMEMVGNIIPQKGSLTFPLIPLKWGHPNHLVNNEINLLEL